MAELISTLGTAAAKVAKKGGLIPEDQVAKKLVDAGASSEETRRALSNTNYPLMFGSKVQAPTIDDGAKVEVAKTPSATEKPKLIQAQEIPKIIAETRQDIPYDNDWLKLTVKKFPAEAKQYIDPETNTIDVSSFIKGTKLKYNIEDLPKYASFSKLPDGDPSTMEEHLWSNEVRDPVLELFPRKHFSSADNGLKFWTRVDTVSFDPSKLQQVNTEATGFAKDVVKLALNRTKGAEALPKYAGGHTAAALETLFTNTEGLLNGLELDEKVPFGTSVPEATYSAYTDLILKSKKQYTDLLKFADDKYGVKDLSTALLAPSKSKLTPQQHSELSAHVLAEGTKILNQVQESVAAIPDLTELGGKQSPELKQLHNEFQQLLQQNPTDAVYSKGVAGIRKKLTQYTKTGTEEQKEAAVWFDQWLNTMDRTVQRASIGDRTSQAIQQRAHTAFTQSKGPAKATYTRILEFQNDTANAIHSHNRRLKFATETNTTPIRQALKRDLDAIDLADEDADVIAVADKYYAIADDLVYAATHEQTGPNQTNLVALAPNITEARSTKYAQELDPFVYLLGGAIRQLQQDPTLPKEQQKKILNEVLRLDALGGGPVPTTAPEFGYIKEGLKRELKLAADSGKDGVMIPIKPHNVNSLVRGDSTQTKYETRVVDEATKIAKRIGAKVSKAKGYIFVTFTTTGFTMPLYGQETEDGQMVEDQIPEALQHYSPEEVYNYIQQRLPTANAQEAMHRGLLKAGWTKEQADQFVMPIVEQSKVQAELQSEVEKQRKDTAPVASKPTINYTEVTPDTLKAWTEVLHPDPFALFRIAGAVMNDDIAKFHEQESAKIDNAVYNKLKEFVPTLQRASQIMAANTSTGATTLHPGELFYIDEDGTPTAVNSGVLNVIGTSIEANKFGTGLAIAGGIVGGAMGIAKARGTPLQPVLGGLYGAAGSATGSTIGGAIDYAIAAYKLKEQLDFTAMLDSAAKMGLADAAFSTTLGAISYGYKGLKALKNATTADNLLALYKQLYSNDRPTMNKILDGITAVVNGTYKGGAWVLDKAGKVISAPVRGTQKFTRNIDGAYQALKDFSHMSDEELQKLVATYKSMHTVQSAEDPRLTAVRAFTELEPLGALSVAENAPRTRFGGAPQRQHIIQRTKDITTAADRLTTQHVASALKYKLEATHQALNTNFKAIEHAGSMLIDVTNAAVPYRFDFNKLVMEPVKNANQQGLFNPTAKHKLEMYLARIQQLGNVGPTDDFITKIQTPLAQNKEQLALVKQEIRDIKSGHSQATAAAKLEAAHTEQGLVNKAVELRTEIDVLRKELQELTRAEEGGYATVKAASAAKLKIISLQQEISDRVVLLKAVQYGKAIKRAGEHVDYSSLRSNLQRYLGDKAAEATMLNKNISELVDLERDLRPIAEEQKNGLRSFNNLLEMRALINEFEADNVVHLKNAKTTTLLNTIKRNIDTEITAVAHNYMPEDLGAAWLESYAKHNQDLKNFNKAAETDLYKILNDPNTNDKEIREALVYYSRSNGEILRTVLAHVPPQTRKNAEGAIVKELVSQHTKNGMAIDFIALDNELRMSKFTTTEAIDFRRAINFMSTIFKSDPDLMTALYKNPTPHMAMPIANTVMGRLKALAMAAATNTLLTATHFTSLGQKLSFAHKVKQLLDNPTNAKRFSEVMKDLPPDSELQSAIQQLALAYAEHGEKAVYPKIKLLTLSTDKGPVVQDTIYGRGILYHANDENIKAAAESLGGITTSIKINAKFLAKPSDIERIIGRKVPAKEYSKPEVQAALRRNEFSGIDLGDRALLFIEDGN
jgi:hypothetical protein